MPVSCAISTNRWFLSVRRLVQLRATCQKCLDLLQSSVPVALSAALSGCWSVALAAACGGFATATLSPPLPLTGPVEQPGGCSPPPIKVSPLHIVTRQQEWTQYSSASSARSRFARATRGSSASLQNPNQHLGPPPT